MRQVRQGQEGRVGRRQRSAGGAWQHLVGEGGGERGRPLQGVGGRGLPVVEVQGGEGRGGDGGGEGGWRGWDGAWPGQSHAPVHLYQGGPIARLLEQLNAHCCLPLPFGPESITLVPSVAKSLLGVWWSSHH